MIIQPILQNKPPYLQLIFFILIILASLFLINVVGILIAIPIYGRSFMDGMSAVSNYSDPEYLSKLKYLQIVNQLALFIVPVVVFAMFTGKTVHGYLKLNVRLPLVFILIALCIIVVSLPVLNWIGDLNASMKLPQSFSGVEQWMRSSETQADDITKGFLGSVSLSSFLVNMLMIAVLPAIGEEFFFRGIMQRIFHEWFKNIHVAIFVTAFIFSAIHFQFFGFVPRFLLGLYLGYIFYWSGNLWVSIFVHFLNNGLIVIISYLSVIGITNMDYETFGSTSNSLILISTLILTMALTYLLYRFRKTKIEENISEFPPQ